MKTRETLSITIPGEPVAKGRPKFTSRNGIAMAYTPKKTANYEARIAYYFTQKYPDYIPTDKPVCMRFLAYFSIPSSFSKKKRRMAECGELRPLKKPDTDNIAKMKDALNGIAYLDDKQVFRELVEKYYSDKPCLEITIFVYDTIEV